MVRYKTRPTGAGNTNRPLTHSSEPSREGLAVNATQERWKSVVGYEGYYEVSDHGRVRSVDRTVVSSVGIPSRRRGCGISPALTTRGYLRVGLSRDGESKLFSVHRLVAAAFCERVADGDVVRHLDGDKENNRAENLTWGTDSENMIDQVRHGNHLHARKAHCPRGHELVMPNLVRAIWVQRSNRSCLACSRARDMARCRPIDLQVESDSHYRRILAAAEEG
ncbi:NUMOD4 motif-containing HNH endonuclease [Rhodococcus qingshengii]|uniref:NUMOD4 motif-containing HNH endonuclease n=1 Tax=Rhodococcus qingshengii TaxID=334542 RepID=UPI0034DE8D0D